MAGSALLTASPITTTCRAAITLRPIGVAIHFPFLDAVGRARQREAQSDVQHAADDLETLAIHQADEQRRLRHLLAELAARLEIADLDASIAEDQLRIVRKQAEAGGDGGPVMTPKDVEQLSIQERQRYVDLLDSRLQLRKTQIFYLRQNGGLQPWIDSMRGQSPPATRTLRSLVTSNAGCLGGLRQFQREGKYKPRAMVSTRGIARHLDGTAVVLNNVACDP